jgi:peroxiredoxin Q/BCP
MIMPAKKKKKSAPKKKPAPAPAKKKKKAAPAAKKPAPAKKAPPPASKVKLAEGDAAPAFSLPGDDGQVHTLAAHKGAPVVVYFYPRDDTPGCTTEACDFRDNMARATEKGAVVYGISKDSLKAHDRFKKKYSLNFTLLSDEDLSVHRAYGAWGDKLMYGKPVLGVIRSTYLIGKDGRVARAWPKVKVNGHVDAVLEAIEAL